MKCSRKLINFHTWSIPTVNDVDMPGMRQKKILSSPPPDYAVPVLLAEVVAGIK